MNPTLCPPPPNGFPNVLIKAAPEDFIVEELPLYEPSGLGTHTYLWIEKRSLNTLDAVRRIASILGKRAADAGIGGLKDARSISRQWISFEHVSPESVAKISTLAESNLRVLKIGLHGNKLKMGHLRGNRFIIRLRLAPQTADAPMNSVAEHPGQNRSAGFQPAQAVAARANEVLNTLQQKSIPNYFGPQRFGRDGNNATLGKMLVQGDTAGFAKAYAEGHGSARPAGRQLCNLLVNAFQSELFNRILALRMPQIGQLQAGDLAYLHRNGAVFSVPSDDDARREQTRADAFEISPSGPLFGEKTLLASERPGELERNVLQDSGVTLKDFGRREAERQPGARRAMRIFFLERPSVEEDAHGVVLRFALPTGSYASVVLREIVGDGSSVD